MLTHNQREILKQAAGQIGYPTYGDQRQMAADMQALVSGGLIVRDWDDDQPTAYATLAGKQVLAQLVGASS